MFTKSKINHIFIEKLMETLLHDKNSPIADLSINCLKPPIGWGNILESIHLDSACDIGLCPFQDIFYGLIKVLPIKNSRGLVPELSKIGDAIERVLTIDRNKLSQAFNASQQSNKLQNYI